MATTQKPDEPKNETPQKLDETVPGGRYEVNGTIVDANGKPVKE